MMAKLTTREAYDNTKQEVERLIAEATALGLLEPEQDNVYTRKIAELSKLMADYEDEYMGITPLRVKSPLVRSIEDYCFQHNLRQKDGARLLGINESVFSLLLSGKRRITMPVAKRIHKTMGISAETILEYA